MEWGCRFNTNIIGTSFTIIMSNLVFGKWEKIITTIPRNFVCIIGVFQKVRVTLVGSVAPSTLVCHVVTNKSELQAWTEKLVRNKAKKQKISKAINQLSFCLLNKFDITNLLLGFDFLILRILKNSLKYHYEYQQKFS